MIDFTYAFNLFIEKFKQHTGAVSDVLKQEAEMFNETGACAVGEDDFIPNSNERLSFRPSGNSIEIDL